MVADNGVTFFVPNLLKGEKAEIETTFSYGKPSDARVVKRLTNSPDRVTPKCKYYDKCGGCSIMHMSYESQLKYKQEKVYNLLKKFGKIDVKVNPTVGVENPWNFRNKIQKPVRPGKKKGEISVGFFAENTHNLISVDNCLIEDKRSIAITDKILELCKKYKVQPYDEDKRTGLLRHILIKTSFTYDEAMVCFVTAQDVFPGIKNLAKDLVNEMPIIKTVVQNINTRKTNVILGEKERIVYGPGRIKDNIFGLDFLISAKSFYQTNPRQIEKLYGLAIEGAKLTGTEKVLDAYCGTGTIGLCASKYAKEVIGVEIVKEAIRDATNNAKINGVTNATFIADDCTDYILNNLDEHFDVIFMDPPRKGSTPEFLNAVKKMSPRKIAYISCNPVTLARDLVFLKDEYSIDFVTPVDLFPHSAHVETVVLLNKKNDWKSSVKLWFSGNRTNFGIGQDERFLVTYLKTDWVKMWELSCWVRCCGSCDCEMDAMIKQGFLASISGRSENIIKEVIIYGQDSHRKRERARNADHPIIRTEALRGAISNVVSG